MATTNRVYCWKDGNRLFVDLNGATIEAESMTFDDQVVTLRFQARINVMKGDHMAATLTPVSRVHPAGQADRLHDECLG